MWQAAQVPEPENSVFVSSGSDWGITTETKIDSVMILLNKFMYPQIVMLQSYINYNVKWQYKAQAPGKTQGCVQGGSPHKRTTRYGWLSTGPA